MACLPKRKKKGKKIQTTRSRHRKMKILENKKTSIFQNFYLYPSYFTLQKKKALQSYLGNTDCLNLIGRFK